MGQGFSNLTSGKEFFEDINWKNVALGGLTGAAFATGIGGLWGAVAIGAASNAGMSAFEGNSWLNIGFSAVVGGAVAGIGYGVGKYLSKRLLNVNTQLGFKDYINMARTDGAKFFARNVIALVSKLYTMSPTFTIEITRGALKAGGNLIGDWF